jgi:hypothetical protein
MARYRQIRKYGNSWIIPLTTYDIKDLGISLGDEADIEDIVIKKRDDNKKENKKN